MKDLTAEEIDPFLDKFTPIYDEKGNEINPIPEGVCVTVYIEHDWEPSGFATNVLVNEMGMELLIAKSWIREDLLQSFF